MNASTPDPTTDRNVRQVRHAVALSVAVAAAVLLLYVSTLCPTVYVSGTGENITAAATLGVPHPPGFPLFCLLGRLCVVALPSSASLAVNALAAMTMAAAAGVLCWIVARGSGVWLAGVASGLLFALARTPWSQAVIGEVYGLSALLLAVELALLLAWRGDLAIRRGTGRRRLFLVFAFVLGIGISVHPLHALMMPGYLVLIATAPARRSALRLLAPAALLVLLGLSLHLYSPLRSAQDPALDWGNPQSPAKLWQYVSASQYRERMFSLGPSEVLTNVGRLGRVLQTQWSGPVTPLPPSGTTIASVLALLLASVGGALLARRRPGIAAGLGLMALTNIAYAINYDIPWEIEVYYIPLILLLAVAGGVAFAGRARWETVLAGAVLAIVLISAVWSNIGVAGRRGLDAVDRYGRDVLDALPERAVLVTPPTNPTFILLYLTAVDGERPDIDIYVHGKQGLSKLGEALDTVPRTAITALQLARDETRPLYYAVRDPLDDLPGFELRPAGVLYRVTPRSDAPGPDPGGWTPPRLDPSTVGPDEDFRLRLIAARYFLARSDHALSRGDTTAAVADRDAARRVAGDHAEVHGDLALRASAEGRRDEAIEHYQRALAIREDAVLVNRMGRVLHEQGDRAGAEAAFRRAIELSPEFATAYSNLGALLGGMDRIDASIEALERAVELDPLSIKAHNNLGMALLKSGDRTGAARAWRRSLDLEPRQPYIARRLESLRR